MTSLTINGKTVPMCPLKNHGHAQDWQLSELNTVIVLARDQGGLVVLTQELQ